VFVFTDDDNEDVFSDEEFEAEMKEGHNKRSPAFTKDSQVSHLIP